MAQPANETKRKGRGLWRPILLIVVVIVLLFLARVFGLGERLGDLRGWIQGLGVWGPIVFIGIYVIATIAAIPGLALTIAAGVIFGSVMGTILVSIASTLGASLAFLIARYFARDSIASSLSKNEKFTKLDQMTEKYGAFIVAFTRLVPLFPFNLLNYGFGLTRVRFWTYVFWSWLCMLPGTMIYVVGSDAFTKAVAEGKVPWTLIISLAAIIVLLLVIGTFVRKIMKKKESESNA